MRSSACIKCVKRKVRCDRNDPCSSCSRRGHACVYADDASNKRIQQLENLVRSLGGDPTESLRKPTVEAASTREGDETIVYCDKDSNYVETRIWPSLIGKDLIQGPVAAESRLFKYGLAQPDLSFRHAHPERSHAKLLWAAFFERVHPIIMLFFEQEVKDLRSACESGQTDLTDQEHVFVFCLYLLTVQSLSNTDQLAKSKSEVVQHYQYHCEHAMMAVGLLHSQDIANIRSLVLYLYAIFIQENFNNSWDVLGLVLRKAERMGLHRDGSGLGLSPWETEKRRRIWWCIQNLDLASETVTGLTSMTLMASWDTRLPLNIEDSDIGPDLEPVEREGITTISHCLWRYWIILQQRNIASSQRKLGITWIVNRELSVSERRVIIDRIEQGLTKRWLSYCDPIKPLDMLVLLLARSLVNFWRRTLLLSTETARPSINDNEALLKMSIQMLSYHATMFSMEQLEPFRWHQKFLFPWSAYVHLLNEIRRITDYESASKLWKHISSVAETMPQIGSIDKRKLQAARMTIDTWKYLQEIQTGNEIQYLMPDFVMEFEQYISLCKSVTEIEIEEAPDGSQDFFSTTLLNGDDWLDWLHYDGHGLNI